LILARILLVQTVMDDGLTKYNTNQKNSGKYQTVMDDGLTNYNTNHKTSGKYQTVMDDCLYFVNPSSITV
jgi:hypothetical protein